MSLTISPDNIILDRHLILKQASPKIATIGYLLKICSWYKKPYQNDFIVLIMKYRYPLFQKFQFPVLFTYVSSFYTLVKSSKDKLRLRTIKSVT